MTIVRLQEGTEVVQAKDNQFRPEWWWRRTEVLRWGEVLTMVVGMGVMKLSVPHGFFSASHTFL